MDYSIEELEQILGDISNKEIRYLKIEKVTDDIYKSLRKYIDSTGYPYYSQYNEIIEVAENLIIKDIEREYTYWTLFKHSIKDFLSIKSVSKEAFTKDYSITTERINLDTGYTLNYSNIQAIANDTHILKGKEVTIDNIYRLFNIKFLDQTIDVKSNYAINKYYNPVKTFNNPTIFLYKTYSYTGGKYGYKCHYLDYKLVVI